MSKGFADRLNQLFDTVYPPGRGPHISADLIAYCQGAGVHVSAPYVSQLRSGSRTNPSTEIMVTFARFFRVDPRYFTDNGCYARISAELVMLARMRDEGVRRIAARTVGLSPQSQHDLICRVEELRRQEHLD